MVDRKVIVDPIENGLTVEEKMDALEAIHWLRTFDEARRAAADAAVRGILTAAEEDAAYRVLMKLGDAILDGWRPFQLRPLRAPEPKAIEEF
jgi:hypothetical protein